MKYSILIAPIETKMEPTYSLRYPAKAVTRYTEAATIFDFNTEADAIEFAQGYLPFSKVMALPGTRKALEFYASVWANEGDVCKQDLNKLAGLLSDPNDWTWDYSQAEVDALYESMDDFDDEEEDVDDGKLIVGSYTMGKSKLTGKYVSLTALCDLPEFNELTREEQLECITPTTINKKKATADMGIMFDIYCRHKAGKLAKPYAYWVQYGDDIRMFHYRCTTKVQNKYRTAVYKFNTWRLRGEHP